MSKEKEPQRQKKAYRRCPASLRESALERMRLGVNISDLARQLGVGRRTLYIWKENSLRQTAPQPAGKTQEASTVQDERDYQIRELTLQVAGLEGELGRAELEKRFFVAALRRIEASRRKPENSGGIASSPRSASGPKRKAD